jgi:hypothetical protein
VIPKSFSASALNVAELCMARYKAEQIERSKGIGKAPASLGTSVHGALEEFVKHTILEGHEEHYDLLTLLMFFRTSYMNTFNTSDPSGEIFDDGIEMLTRWFERQDFKGVTVLSCEVKENFPVKTTIGEIPFNYIWDRFDQIGEGEYKVVDYKTNRWGIRPQDLKKKIQARCYGLAAQIKKPDAKRIWVEFDMLRHDPVGIVYTREENIATWKFIKELAERIIATPVDETPETLNAECRFCVRMQSCGALKRNIASGGIYTVTSAADAVDRRATLEYQAKAIEAAIRELDEMILTEARAQDILEFESEMNRLEITLSAKRSVDPEMVARVIGDDLFKEYGGVSITMANVDKLLKSKKLDDAKKSQLRSLIFKKVGEPSVKIHPKNGLDDD